MPRPEAVPALSQRHPNPPEDPDLPTEPTGSAARRPRGRTQFAPTHAPPRQGPAKRRRKPSRRHVKPLTHDDEEEARSQQGEAQGPRTPLGPEAPVAGAALTARDQARAAPA